MFLDALEAFFKLGDQRCFTGREAVAAHDAPEVIAARTLVPVVHGHRIFGRPACDKDDDVGFGGPVHDRQFAPLLNGVLHSADRVPIFRKQVRIELISFLGSNVDIARIRQSARKRRYGRGSWLGCREGGNCSHHN